MSRIVPVALALVLAACSSSSGGSGGSPDAGGDASAGTGGTAGASGAGGSAGASGTGGAAGASGAAGAAGTTSTGPCTPDATQPCSCSGTGVGTERCAADGSAWSACFCETYTTELAVSPTGDDSAAGSLAAPFKTLERAKQKIGELGSGDGVVVWLRAGVYPLSSTLTLDASVSGSVWRGYPGESARVIGGVELPSSSFQPVTSSSPIYARMDPAAQAAVVEAPLPVDPGSLSRRGFCGAAAQSPTELFVGGDAMTLARWPDKDQDDAAAGLNHGFASVAEAVSDQVWRYAGDRPSRWQDPGNVWFHGFWKYAWADCHVEAASIDTSTKTVTLADSPGYGVAAGQPWYAYNIPEEITEPGEYWIDRTNSALYLWPPAGFAGAESLVSTLDGPIVTLKNASHVTLRDFTVEVGRSKLVTIEGGDHDSLIGLTLRNAGTDAGSVSGVSQLVQSCNVYGAGNGGFSVSGGDRVALTAGNNAVENSDFHQLSRWEWTYRPAVRLSGDGNSATHNDIHDLPHSAILYGGNDHDIELNEIDHVCQFSSDAGAIYSGRDWGARGNVIKHNFIHDLSTYFQGYGVHGIYLDDCLSGVTVEGNVLYKISGYGIEHGGGRDDIMVNNIIVHSGGGLTADRRCVTWLPNGEPNNTPGDSWNLLEKLENVGYQSATWSARFPECAAIPDDWTAISSPPSHWLEPEGSVLARNIGFDNGVWAKGTTETFAAYADDSNNLEDVDPQFVDESTLDLALKSSSPAYTIPGFQPIPFADIGVKP